MQVGVIAGANRNLDAPVDWNEERDGKCGTLAVRVDWGPPCSMTSAWYPTPEEIALIVKGAPIHLEIVSASHPPVLLTVGEAPK